MTTFRDYVKPETLEEAWQLNQKRSCKVMGGMMWLRLGNRTISKGVDLSGVLSDRIEENNAYYTLGAMVTLRQLEQHPGLNAFTQNAMADCVKDIVGVQFRNMATLGGSLYGRFGFSDVLTLFLALHAQVELYKGGRIPLSEYVGMPYDNDILTSVVVPKQNLSVCYQSIRNQATDFPVLTCAVSCVDGEYTAAVGARPGRAQAVTGPAEGLAQKAMELPFGTNARASAEYRQKMAGVLVRRGLETLTGGEQ